MNVELGHEDREAVTVESVTVALHAARAEIQAALTRVEALLRALGDPLEVPTVEAQAVRIRELEAACESAQEAARQADRMQTEAQHEAEKAWAHYRSVVEVHDRIRDRQRRAVAMLDSGNFYNLDDLLKLLRG